MRLLFKKTAAHRTSQCDSKMCARNLDESADIPKDCQFIAGCQPVPHKFACWEMVDEKTIKAFFFTFPTNFHLRHHVCRYKNCSHLHCVPHLHPFPALWLEASTTNSAISSVDENMLLALKFLFHWLSAICQLFNWRMCFPCLKIKQLFLCRTFSTDRSIGV